MNLTKTIWTETGHRLLNYDGLCSNVHGHSYKWDLTVSGNVKRSGFVIDFKELKKVMKSTILTYDHAFVVYEKDPLVQLLAQANTKIITLNKQPSVENMLLNIIEPLQEQCDRLGVTLERLTAQETSTSVAEWGR